MKKFFIKLREITIAGFFSLLPVNILIHCYESIDMAFFKAS